MKVHIVYTIILCLMLGACHSTKSIAGKKSFYDFDESNKLSFVMDRAVSYDKLIFVDFHASWCLPCKIMDEQIDQDPMLKRALKENYITYKVNGEKGFGRDLMVIFDIKAFPTFLFLDQQGKELARQEGTASNQELYELSQASIRLTE